MLVDKFKKKGILHFRLEDKRGNVIKDVFSENFMTKTLSRLLTEQLSSFMQNYGSNDAIKPAYGGFSSKYPTPSKLSDGSVKFALALTNNTLPIDIGQQDGLRELPGTLLGMSKGVKAVSTDEDFYIEYIKVRADGGIELKAVVGFGVTGTVGTVGLVIPKDLDFNTDGTGLLYDYPIGNILYTDIMSNTYVSNCVKFNGAIYFTDVGGSFGSGYYFYLYKYENGVISKVYEGEISNQMTCMLQVVEDELWVITASNKIVVLGKDMQLLRTEGVKSNLGVSISDKNDGILFVNEGYVYGVGNLSTSSKTITVYKGKLQSTLGGDESNVTKTIQYTDEAHAKSIVYGSYKGEGTKIITATGKEVDISTLFTSDTVESAVGVPIEGNYPKALVKGSLIDGVWYGVHYQTHDMNTLEGFNSSSNLLNSVYYPNKNKYLIKCLGGSALTCNVIEEPIEKTANDKLTITYVIY